MEKTAGDGECYSSHNARRSGPGVMRRCCLRLFVRESVRALEIHGHCSATTTGVETADWVDTHKADAQARNNTHEQCTTEHLNDTSRRRRVHLSECYRARLAEKAEQEVANLHSIRFVFSLWGARCRDQRSRTLHGECCFVQMSLSRVCRMGSMGKQDADNRVPCDKYLERGIITQPI